jgi:hypothetical protein
VPNRARPAAWQCTFHGAADRIAINLQLSVMNAAFPLAVKIF